MATPSDKINLLKLPAEVRTNILEYVFENNPPAGFINHGDPTGVQLDDAYSSFDHLRPLLTCRQLYNDGSILALNQTSFVISNLFVRIPTRLGELHPKQIQGIRSIAFVADSRHFKSLSDWGNHAFGVSSLNLDTLTFVLHRSSSWHYLFDFTSEIVKLLRTLEGVRRVVFVRNAALVKGSFKTWYNRLLGLILKVDHHERYDKRPANLEKTWWTWSYDNVGQSFCLEACAAKPLVDEETYMRQVLPLMEHLRKSVEDEEWNPDPRARNMYY